MDDLAYFYLDLIEGEGWSDLHLTGIGLGGWIAAEIAVRSTASLATLTLIDAVGIRISGPATPDILDTYPKSMDERFALMWHDPDTGRARVGDPKEMSDAALETFIRNEEAETLYTWKPFMHNPALARRLHRIRIPTLVLWGEHDKIVSPAYGATYADRIPGAAFETVPDAGHLPHIERPDAVVEAMFRFIEQAKK